MENWGLINLKPYYILWNEETGSIDDKCAIVMIIAHEIAHQWFGK